MLTRDKALQILEVVHDLTRDVDVLISSWHWKQERVFKDLETLQIGNSRVYSLFRLVSTPAQWNDALAQEVKHFLVEECENENLLAKKSACLFAEDILSPTWQRAYCRLRNILTSDVRQVAFLFSDLFAFDALPEGGYAAYLTIFDPVISLYNNQLTIRGGHITINKLGHTDTLQAYADGTDAIKDILAFAKALRERLYAYRQEMGLSDAVNIGIGIAYGRCKFHLLTGEPHPDTSTSSTPVWYEAAKLVTNAEKLCKYLRERGGVILVSEDVSNVLGDVVCRINMKTLNSFLNPQVRR
ncbi:MAG: hypothetical protein ACRESZ_12580 [Methylococcales bacterium]